MTTVSPREDLKALEQEVLEHLDAEAGHVEEDVHAAADAPEAGGDDLKPPSIRYAVVSLFPTIGAAIMVGGVFTGVGGRIYAALAGALGVALAVLVGRLRKPLAANAIILVGLFTIGLLLVLPSGVENVGAIRSIAAEAATSGDVLRPPVPLTPGWQAIIGWLMGIVGFAAAWVATIVKKPAFALLLPLPIAAIAAISVPKDAQVASGIVVLVLFAISLGLLSSAQSVGEDDERPSLAYEVRRVLRALPVIALIIGALIGLQKLNILFPDPYIDPTQEPQKPKTVPLSEVEDRVLFTVESSITGPWRIGSLDVYDGKDWRLPPFAENEVDDVPRSGVVDEELEPGVQARFSIAGLTGAVLPTLPNTVGIVAEGPPVAYDSRNGNIRVSQGQVQAGLAYAVAAAGLPSVDDLRALTAPVPADVRRFAEMPVPPPPAAQTLIDQAEAEFDNKWDQFDFLRTYVLDNVTATGAGVPASVPPERIQDMLGGSKEGTPYEIVAAQAMLARWIDVPARIGYGFDGGDPVDGELQVRPKHGATFVEVYFPTYKWLPVIGVPKKAKPTVGGDPSQQQFDPSILPSDDITVQLFLPVLVEPGSIVGAQIRQAALIGIPILLLLGLLYATFPALSKAVIRSRRRAAAEAAGPRARVALAYAEWRDFATDFGFRHQTDTPLMFLDRFVEDPDHTELAWLVTRVLWGDLQHQVDQDDAQVAEELSRSLRRRLAIAQPATVRAVAVFSRLSLRHPYAPETDLRSRSNREEKRRVLAPA
jgi:hypothetical protein